MKKEEWERFEIVAIRFLLSWGSSGLLCYSMQINYKEMRFCYK